VAVASSLLLKHVDDLSGRASFSEMLASQSTDNVVQMLENRLNIKFSVVVP
jgi:hypothetical protein